MQYLGYVVLAGAAFLVGWILKAPKLKPCPQRVSVTLGKAGNNITKDLYPPALPADTGAEITWHIQNNTGNPVDVLINNFRVKGGGEPKNPFTGRLSASGIPNGGSGEIKGHVKPNSFLKEHPPATEKEENKLYQDFTYSLEVNGKVIDPEIRIREC